MLTVELRVNGEPIGTIDLFCVHAGETRDYGYAAVLNGEEYALGTLTGFDPNRGAMALVYEVTSEMEKQRVGKPFKETQEEAG